MINFRKLLKIKFFAIGGLSRLPLLRDIGIEKMKSMCEQPSPICEITAKLAKYERETIAPVSKNNRDEEARQKRDKTEKISVAVKLFLIITIR